MEKRYMSRRTCVLAMQCAVVVWLVVVTTAVSAAELREFVGPMPREMQNYTVRAAGIPPNGRNPEVVRTFISPLRTPFAVNTIKAKGMEID